MGEGGLDTLVVAVVVLAAAGKGDLGLAALCSILVANLEIEERGRLSE